MVSFENRKGLTKSTDEYKLLPFSIPTPLKIPKLLTLPPLGSGAYGRDI